MTTVIVFSHLRWEFVYQRPQHLLSELAQRHCIVFVEEPVGCDDAPWLERIVQGPNLLGLVPHTPVRAPGFHDEQLPLLRPLLDAFVQEEGLDDAIGWVFTPMAAPLITQEA